MDLAPLRSSRLNTTRAGHGQGQQDVERDLPNPAAPLWLAQILDRGEHTMLRRLVLAALTAAAPSFAAADVMDDIAASGKITLGFRLDAPPFSYRSELGEPTGLAVDLCRLAAQQIRISLGLETLTVDYEPVTAADRFEALVERRIDLLCGPTTQTLTRREKVDFSIPYFIDGSSVVFRAGPMTSLEDIANEQVGALAGTTTEAIVKSLSEKQALNLTLRSFESHVDGLTALENGEVSAYFGDQAILRYQIGRMRPSVPLQFSPNQFSFEPYALTMKRGESRLRLEVDRALSSAFADGTIYTLISSSLGEVTLSDLALSVYEVVALPE
jgi:polar amino acid transport system substrate-binding protein/glutamate/aspartate transport system substrate-binding protein